MKENKRLKVVIIALAAALVLAIGFSVLLATSAGAANGNTFVLLTKGYMDQQVMPQINEKNGSQDSEILSLNNKYTTLLAQYSALSDRFNSYLEGGDGDITVSTKGFVEVKIDAGKALYPTGENHQCIEVILRRGSLQVVSPYDTLSILDATTGAEMTDGTNLPVNHYILVPHSNDGRCLAAMTEDAWVLVRGEFTVE